MILSFEKQRKKNWRRAYKWYHLISLRAFPLDSYKKYAFLYTTKTHIIYFTLPHKQHIIHLIFYFTLNYNKIIYSFTPLAAIPTAQKTKVTSPL